jgi:hypothetical protein
MGRGRAVVDREPDFVFGSFERAQDRSEPLAISDKRRVKQEKVRNEDWRERNDDTEAEKEEAHHGSDKDERENRGARPARLIRSELCFHREKQE